MSKMGPAWTKSFFWLQKPQAPAIDITFYHNLQNERNLMIQTR